MSCIEAHHAHHALISLEYDPNLKLVVRMLKLPPKYRGKTRLAEGEVEQLSFDVEGSTHAIRTLLRMGREGSTDTAERRSLH